MCGCHFSFNQRYNNTLFSCKTPEVCGLYFVFLFPPLTLYNSLLAFMLELLSLQSKAISSSSLSLSQISSSVQCDTNACRLSKLRRRHDECSYSNHTNKHHRHADQQCRGKKQKKTHPLFSHCLDYTVGFGAFTGSFEDGLNQNTTL